MCVGGVVLKIRHKELAVLLGVSEGYSRVLLRRRGLKLSNEYLYEIMDMVRCIKSRRDGKVLTTIK